MIWECFLHYGTMIWLSRLVAKNHGCMRLPKFGSLIHCNFNFSQAEPQNGGVAEGEHGRQNHISFVFWCSPTLHVGMNRCV